MSKVIGSFLLVALISAFLDPNFGLNTRSVAVYLGFLVALVVMLVSFKAPGVFVHRRRHHEWGELRVLPWTIVLAALFVLISRLFNLQPGYLYGVIIGVAFLESGTLRDEGLESTAGMIWALVVAVAGWAALSWYRTAAPEWGDFASVFAQTFLAAIVVAGLEATAFGLMPFRFMPGHTIYRWHRWLWAILSFLSIFAFIHILIGPAMGYLIDLDPIVWLAALGVFGAFATFTLLFWGYFRFVYREPAEEAAAPEG